MKKLFLIDGHSLIFKMYYAFLRRPMINSKGEDTSILFGFTKYILELIGKENPTPVPRTAPEGFEDYRQSAAFYFDDNRYLALGFESKSRIMNVADGKIVTITDSTAQAVVNVNGIMVIGNKPTALSETPSKTTAGISGKFSTGSAGYIKVYPGVDGITGSGTTFNINGIEYMTVYGQANVSTVLGAEKISLTGLTITNVSDVTKWNLKESMLGTALTSTSVTGSSVPDLYYSTQIMTLTIKNEAKVAFNIDGVSISADKTSISVAAGSYIFSVSGAGTVSLNDKTITNQIEIPSTGTLTLTIAAASSGGDTSGDENHLETTSFTEA